MVICQPGVEEVLRKGGGLEEGKGLLKIILCGVIDSGQPGEAYLQNKVGFEG